MGRTALLLVIGFNITFMMMGFRINDAAKSAYEKYIGYSEIEQAGLTLESAANIAISKAFMTAKDSIQDVICTDNPFMRGKFTIIKKPVFDAFHVQDGYDLAVTGTYPLAASSSEIAMATNVRVTGSFFSQYVFYSESEKLGGTGAPIYWRTGEVCRGRLHTQDYVYVDGNPVFKGKVTTKLGIKKYSTSNKPVFEQGYSKADVTLPADLTDLKTLGNVGGAKYPDGCKVYVEFQGDGSVIVRTGTNGWNAKPADGYTYGSATVLPSIKACSTYSSIGALTSSGVLLVNKAELHVKGVLNGRITLGAVGTGSMVYIDSSVTYKDPPPSYANPTNVSNDCLGIVAENKILVNQYLNDNSASGTLKNVTIHASMFSQKDGFGAENYDSRGASGYLKVVGGMQQKIRNAVGQGTSGFTKDYDFDKNLEASAPPGYPQTHVLIKNWVDNTSIPEDFWK